MAYTPYVSELILDFLFTTTTAGRPTSWDVALFDADPEAAGAELADANYVRQSVTFAVADADSNGRSEATNVAAVTFPDLAAAATVAYVVIFDQLGNQLASLALNVARDLGIGDVFSVPVGELIIRGENA